MEYIFILALAVYAATLGRRISDLERRVEQKSQAPIMPIPPAPQAQTGSFSPIPPPPPLGGLAAPLPHYAPTAVSAAPAEDAFVAWIKRDFFVKLGALLLLIAFGWFVSYAFANNWIGPWGRILFGVISGALVFCFGAYRITTFRQQGALFVVLGSAIAIMSLWAAREIYGFLTPTLALILMMVPVVLTAFLSVVQRMPSLALAGFVMGTVAPFFTAAPEPSLVGLSVYLLALVIGTLWVAFLIDALFLTPVALFAVAFWSFPYFGGSASALELNQGLLFAFAFTTCFFISNVVNLFRHHSDEAKVSHITAGLGTGAYLYFWIAGATSGAFESFLYAAWMALFIMAGFLVLKRTGSTIALYLYGAVGLAYLVALTASILSGVALTMTYAAELALLIVSTRFIPVERRARQVLSWLYVPLCFVALQHVFSSSWNDAVLHRDFAALLVVTASLLISGISLRRGSEVQQHLHASASLLVTTGVSVLILVWLILHAKVEDPLASTLFFMATATGSVVMYSIAVRMQLETVRVCATALSGSYLFLVGLSFVYIGSPEWSEGLFHLDAGVLLSIIIGFWLATVLAFQKSIRDVSVLPVQVLSSLAGLYSLTYVWLAFHAVLTDGLATTLSLIVYAGIGLGLFVFGRMKDVSFVKLWGGALLCGVVLRLLFVEIWALSLTMRIITFFVVGVLLISTAFIGRKRE